MSPVFDEIDINNGADVQVTIKRRLGPIEAGSYDPGTGLWTAAPGVTEAGGVGFGVDGSGNPYFQVGGADLGEDADVFVDALNGLVWHG